MLAYIVHPDSNAPQISGIRDFLTTLKCDVTTAASMAMAAQDGRLVATSDSLVVVPTTDEWRPDVAQMIKDASRLVGRAFILYIADKISPADYKALARLGAADSTDWDSSIREIAELVERLKAHGANAADANSAQAPQNCVVSFVGTGGGCGNTTVTLETGVLLASGKNGKRRRVALLDLDLRDSVVCDYLDVAPRLDLSAFANNPERLDHYMLDILASRHASGLDVFACPKSSAGTSAGAGDETAIYLLLNRLLERYNIVLVDVPAHRAIEADEVIRNSDFTFVTSLYSVPSIKRSQQLAQRIRELGVGPDRRAIVVNDSETNFLGAVVKRFDVEGALAGERICYVRRDRQFALECADAGFSMTLTDPKRGVSKDLARVAEIIQTVSPAALG